MFTNQNISVSSAATNVLKSAIRTNNEFLKSQMNQMARENSAHSIDDDEKDKLAPDEVTVD